MSTWLDGQSNMALPDRTLASPKNAIVIRAWRPLVLFVQKLPISEELYLYSLYGGCINIALHFGENVNLRSINRTEAK